ncbi:tRNA (N6-isopentenyl adenosine(37)-C2)-methylthiotransferase MiaB [Bdellovibrio svalbardensis]|uniref:tRNA-2-methylthio-N(6)-dimethylallyladenosine synthase n=1 Tax=Bdellovibrio svalbardensis TaxID=2972972 RepID=A0ABT6DIC4_9BACT|nr:tRNA (N6-isopentenyl adenosine(37)-C2)-methylthiotransferase MiaB [Bdellovibrio svalbardensis]MDG0816546.1 tRNA (N6-isopentenyl adenosine(37)-C2)-methylthiotransferase MiaB [Bdellovibrio svalbardensis]
MPQTPDNSETTTSPVLNHDLGQGRGVWISTYGCQMNVNDTERMYSLLEMQNFVPVDEPEKADLIIINSCSVREKAVHKTMSEVGTFRKLKDKNPELRIGVGGCVGQQEKENLIKSQPMIDFVFGTDQIDNLPSLVAQTYEKRGKHVSAKFEHRAPYHIETMVRNPGVSTFVNITKGCDNFCTFCVVPYTRGREKSRPVQHIITDIRHLVKRGVKEVTLVGQNVNSYADENVDFSDLMAKVAKETDIERIRFTTSHPKDFDQKLADTIAQHSDKIMEYIHLPFQSGNTRILDRMNRIYTREEYFAKIEMLKKTIPNVVFSTDIIVGFPGETEEEFLDTVSMVEQVRFENIFAFVYSPRPFTKAAKYEDQVPEEIKSERLNRLFDIHEKMAFEIVKRYEGQTLKVLVEHADREQGKAKGRSTANKLVHFLGSEDLVGKTVDVRITKAFPSALRGELVQ